MAPYCKKVLLILFGLLLGVSIIETSLRLFPDQASKILGLDIHRKYICARDPFLGWKLRPHSNHKMSTREISYSIQTVNLGYEGIGFRDDGIDTECFAVVVGDSLTEGWGVDTEDIWVELLEKETGLDFANMGVGGYGTIQEVRMLQKYGAPLRPKLVLLAFFINDIGDNNNIKRNLQYKAGINRTTIRRWLYIHTYTFAVLYDRIYNPIIEMLKHITHNIHNERPPWSFYYKDNTFSLAFSYRRLVDMNTSESQEGWRLTQESFLEAKAICKDINARFAIILIPDAGHSYWHIIKGLNASLDRDLDQLYPLIRDFCNKQDIMCLDLTPTFREHARKGEHLYYTNDGHWNKEGSHLAAKTILEFLKQQDLLTKNP